MGENQAQQAGKKVLNKVQTLAKQNNINLQEVEQKTENAVNLLAKFLQDKYPNRVHQAKTQIAKAEKEAKKLVNQNKNQSAKQHFQTAVAVAKEQCNSIPEQFAYLRAPCLQAINQGKQAVKSNVDLNLTYQQQVDKASAEAASLAQANQKKLNQILNKIEV